LIIAGGFDARAAGIHAHEAMAAARPVIACSSGGLMENIVSGVTGLLAEPTAREFANAMVRMVMLEKSAVETMARNARQRACGLFSRDVLGRELTAVLKSLLKPHTE